MKLGSFTIGGQASYGLFMDGGVVDLARRLGANFPDLLALVQAGALGEAAGFGKEKPDHALSAITFLPLYARHADIYCCGRNYRDHVAEMGHAEAPSFPNLFMKTMGSLVGHEQPIVRPKVSDIFDYESELAVVIGRRGRHIAKERALDHVAGYTIFMDGSIRDWQQRTTDQGKNFRHTSSLGPWLVTPDAVPPPATWDGWRIQGRLNGQVMQSSTIGAMIHTIPDLIAYYSTMAELQPGDVIATGTPSGVGHGRKPPVYLKPGDVFEVEIDGVGVLRNPVVAE